MSSLATVARQADTRAADYAPTGQGRPLDRATRAPFEQLLGHDFARVRVHTDARAADAAAALHADAFTVGEQIAFAPGRFAPASAAGRGLIGHELAHVVQQRPGRDAPSADQARAEREADAAAGGHRPRLSRRPIAVHRQPAKSKPKAAPAKPVAGITKAELADRLKELVGHDVKISVGDKDKQTQQVREIAKFQDPAHADAIDKLPLPKTWKKWDPGANATVYDRIADAFSDVRRVEGGLPDLQEIVFYDQEYQWDGAKWVVGGHAASWLHARTGSLKTDLINVYKIAADAESPTATLFRGPALARSTADAPAKQEEKAGPAEVQRLIAHEVGHGIDFATDSIAEFNAAVGWYPPDSDTPTLYDLPAGGPTPGAKQPPSKSVITTSNWNSADHREQPISRYATTNPRDDFAESLAAFVYSPQVLKARSPARYDYFHNIWRRAIWSGHLVRNEKAPPPKKPAFNFSWPTGGN